MGEKNVMTLRVPGKGDKERILPLPPKTQAVLEAYRAIEHKALRLLSPEIRRLALLQRRE